MVSAKFNKKYIIKSFSKINLHLNVLQKNKNNLHKIESLVMFCGIHDRIELKKSKTNFHNINFGGNILMAYKKKIPLKIYFLFLIKKNILKTKNLILKLRKIFPIDQVWVGAQ